ncbi:cytochrome P450 [Eremomyces bilateralis CBS 781.70]|uniref:Cytochrome P450 n=1 Tax=Eremomyces bilateralis CBS 781.70 TaxID=1392243 RepID=A0A6G1FTC6_9PEZI|nr:cytochrome P450 [Eremomyces bilateralis CBS 781.70]KAF1808911.1 cytochrome P450 [Eremomyces bilateralis CBS 781.70]
MTYYAWRGDRHVHIYKLHQKYGPVVRAGPNALSFNSNTALKSIYGYRANVQKSDFYRAFPANKHAISVHSSIDKQMHARKRRVLSYAFSDQAIKAMERFVLANIRTASQLLTDTTSTRSDGGEKVSMESKGWGYGLNVADFCNWLTFDIMGDLAFGKAFGMLESPQNRFAVDLVSKTARRHTICGSFLPLHHAKLDSVLFPKIAKGRAEFIAYSKAQVLERTALGQDIDRKDFFHYLLQARDPETGQGFSQNELWGEANLLIVAGSDTTSTAMSATIHYLLHNPRVMEKVCLEVRRAFLNVEEIVSGPNLTGCTYLRACIDEAMRLSPPVPGFMPREVLQGGIEIDSYHVPAGIDVYVPHYAIHHNSAYFPRPFEYIPERWIEGAEGFQATTESVQLAQSAFSPFSHGPRGCIGKGLAYVEMMLIMGRLIFEFDFKLSATQKAPGGWLEGRKPEAPGEYMLVDGFASWKSGPIMEVKKAVRS